MQLRSEREVRVSRVTMDGGGHNALFVLDPAKRVCAVVPNTIEQTQDPEDLPLRICTGRVLVELVERGISAQELRDALGSEEMQILLKRICNGYAEHCVSGPDSETVYGDLSQKAMDSWAELKSWLTGRKMMVA